MLWAGASVTPASAQAGGEALTPYMAQFQRHMHKLALSIDATNQPLAQFYTTKLKEDLEIVGKKVPTYDNLQVGALSKAMLGAPLTPLETALKGSDWAAINKAYDGVMTGCNSCHIATQRQFIKVTRVKTNPFSQDFAK
jgi:hypothetical protein